MSQISPMNYNIPPELSDVIPGYLNRRDQDISDIRAAIDSDNYETIERIGHKLKGNGSSFGFDRLSEIGDELMQACREKDKIQMINLMNELKREVVNIKAQIL